MDNIRIKELLIEDEEFDKYFICLKCKKDLRMANYKLLPCNQHHNGCEDCWNEIFKNNNGGCISDKCKLVIKDFSSLPDETNEMFKKQFKTLKIDCPYSTNSKLIKNSNSGIIGSNSTNSTTTNENDLFCKEIITVGELEDHLENCDARKCKHCKSIEHKDYCTKKLVKCPKCFKEYESQQIIHHDNECEEAEIICEMCNHKVKRCSINQHYISQIISHAPIIIKKMDELEAKLNQLKNEKYESENRTKVLEYLEQPGILNQLQDIINNNHNSNNNNTNNNDNNKKRSIEEFQIDNKKIKKEYDDIIEMDDNSDDNDSDDSDNEKENDSTFYDGKENDTTFYLMDDCFYRGTCVIKNYVSKRKVNKKKMIKFMTINGKEFTFFFYFSGLRKNLKDVAIYLTQKNNMKFEFDVKLTNQFTKETIKLEYKYNKSNRKKKGSVKKYGIDRIIDCSKLEDEYGWLTNGDLNIDLGVRFLDQ